MKTTSNTLPARNPSYAARISQERSRPVAATGRNVASLGTGAGRPRPPVAYARLPQAPVNASPVPHLTSLYHNAEAGPYGDRSYPGNCSGNLIKDLLRYFQPHSVFDPCTGSGTCKDVCDELGIYCWSSDLRRGRDACDPAGTPRACFEFAWLHPPYWRQKIYTADPRDLSRAPTSAEFLRRYERLLANAAGALVSGGTLAVLVGDYCDRNEGFIPLTYWTKHLAFGLGLTQCATDIIRFNHGAGSGRKVYTSAFIPGLHDVCVLFKAGRRAAPVLDEPGPVATNAPRPAVSHNPPFQGGKEGVASSRFSGVVA